MSWWGSKTFEELVDRATSENLPIGSEDLALNLEICDKIKSKEVQPKDAIRLLKKRLNHKNPNVQILTVKLADICVKNGGDHFLTEVASREFVDNLVSIVKAPYGTNPEVRSKILSSLQVWALAFKGKPNLTYMTDTYNRLKLEGLNFPSIESIEASSIMVETAAAPEWTDSDVCMRCRTPFTTFNRKHHCRNCGQTFCGQCSSKNLALPLLGITQEVRVCDGCYSKLSSKTNTPPSATSPSISRSSTDVMNSNSTTAVDVAKREQEELERAIALSLQSNSQQMPKKSVTFNVPAKTNSASSISSKPAPSSSHEDEEDEDLKAAIAASLQSDQQRRSYDPRDYSLSYAQKSQEDDSLSKQVSNMSVSSAPPASSSSLNIGSNAVIPSAPNPYDLSTTELENVRLFSELVERTEMDVQARGPQVLNPAQIQTLYGLVAPLQAKLARSLEDTHEKYRAFYDYNEKATNAIKSYDAMLQERLAIRYGAPPQYYGVPVPQQHGAFLPHPEATANGYLQAAGYGAYSNYNQPPGVAPPPQVYYPSGPQSYEGQPPISQQTPQQKAPPTDVVGSHTGAMSHPPPESAQQGYNSNYAPPPQPAPGQQPPYSSYTYSSEQQQQQPYSSTPPSQQQQQQPIYAPGYTTVSSPPPNAPNSYNAYQGYVPPPQQQYYGQQMPQQVPQQQQPPSQPVVAEAPLIEL